jgi:hypothetical protein
MMLIPGGLVDTLNVPLTLPDDRPSCAPHPAQMLLPHVDSHAYLYSTLPATASQGLRITEHADERDGKTYATSTLSSADVTLPQG